MMQDLGLVLANFRDEANVLRLNGHTTQAATIDRVCDAVRESVPLWLTWLSEHEARLRSGFGERYFRSRFPAWVQQKLAEQRGRNRYYRSCVVPQPQLASVVREQARRDESGAA